MNRPLFFLARQGKAYQARIVGSLYRDINEKREKVRYAGLVICRQWPGTAGDVVFMTFGRGKTMKTEGDLEAEWCT